jgi:[ribosomal protein S5]-alanine N-acetyltransferase
MTVLVTPRLILRPLSPSDADAYVAMRFHPGVAQWLPASSGEPLERARATIAAFAADWTERGYAPWGAFERVAIHGSTAREGRLVGHVGLRFLQEFGGTEVLYAFHPDLHGGGYAREAAEASLDFGFDVVGLPSILAITLDTNVRSWGLMKRLGMTRGPDGHYKGLDVVRYDIDAATWRDRRNT